MAMSPEVVVGSLVGVIAGAYVTEKQEIGLPGGTYGGAAIGGVLGGLAGRMLFGTDGFFASAATQAASVAGSQAMTAAQQQAAPVQPQVVVVQQPAPVVHHHYPQQYAHDPYAQYAQAGEIEDEYADQYAEEDDFGQYGQPIVIGRPRRGYAEQPQVQRVPRRQAAPAPMRAAPRPMRQQQVAPPPMQRQRDISPTEVGRVQQAGRRLLLTQNEVPVPDFEREMQREMAGRVLLGRF